MQRDLVLQVFVRLHCHLRSLQQFNNCIEVSGLEQFAPCYFERIASDPYDVPCAILADAHIAPKALNAIVERTQGYPFFLQEWASVAWNNAEGPEITFEDIDHSYAETLALLDEGFFRVRIDRLTKSEIQFVKTMSSLGDGPYAMADVARAMDRSLSSLGPSRASIIAKGMIYSTDHGFLDFTVPLFADFMRRQE
ncbi:hypothetical protein [Rhizobium herbae]|uniref:Uncharacterized protein n=1 Tax=Rhizobium herbae TaxID=508661 RepID=A0ABS4EW60_9HYPH|nr:hypothetical protein [Rhizobium herbae]MBP1862200.1 hypothetical protein [Rhizobium herbae]